MRFKDKVVVITGAGSGIGRATAELFAREGAKVVAADIDLDATSKVVQQIRQKGQEATFLQVNVGSDADVKHMIQTAINTYGRIDVLFNNAGVAGEPLDETNEDKWRRVIDINLTGPFLACLYAIPIMRKQGCGNIINTSSIGGLKAGGRSPSYTASKGGIVMLSRTLAKILAKDNIRVNCICPGATDTDLTEAFMKYPKTEEERQKAAAIRLSHIPMGRSAKPEEIASVVLFLASDESSFVNGVALPVDGGTLA
jgi:NAD(P)-dependent dehydrogenase (short-subunit alcohol dehydrogenase family)